MALPERHYDLLATLLLRASRDRGAGDPQEVARAGGHDFGFEVGAGRGGRRPRRARARR